MTIAAGFLCDDGVVICGDTLLSANYRRQGRKAWLWQDKADNVVALAGAGDYVLLRLAKERIFRDLDAAGDQVGIPGHVTREVIGPALAAIHDEHVDKADAWAKQAGYGVWLVIAVRDASGCALYETSLRACSEVDSFSCVGSGGPVGNYVASTVFSRSLTLHWARVAAAYVIQQAKAYGDDCGGDTNMIVVPRSGVATELNLNRVRQLEGHATAIHENFGLVLSSLIDPSYGDQFEILRDAMTNVAGLLQYEDTGKKVKVRFQRTIRIKEPTTAVDHDTVLPEWADEDSVRRIPPRDEWLKQQPPPPAPKARRGRRRSRGKR